MRKITLAAAAAFAVLLLAGMGSSAYAVYVSLDVPYYVDVKGKEAGDTTTTVDSPSGYILGVGNLIGWFGVGYESYQGKVNVTGAGDVVSAETLKYTFTDLLIDLPIPLVHLGLGYGVGQVKLDAFDAKWDASQYFARLGIPIGAIFDIHVGYHVISAKGTGTVEGDKFDSHTSTVGVRFGF